ncbi:hypothetical protein IWQ60_000262 [Tieghemiomyces parasiticus]|uniref:Uncharacterized protein n=1 Tax=Tieghemiomyces parasiticus TaxID=78921 RepID=A0A9W8ALH3_9FUNG|nr:hypothetical protein IWQ60_000262 [Tieghemiomyces parasiticus]
MYEKVLTAIDQYQITYASFGPGLVQKLSHHPAAIRFDGSSLKFTVTGSTSVAGIVLDQIAALFPAADIHIAYGMTELTLNTHMTPTDNPYPGSVGLLYPNLEAKIVDPNGRELSYGEPGELCIRGPTVMQGYHNDLEATAAIRDHEGFLRTGDVARVNRAGFYFVAGRQKDMIWYQGCPVAPATLDAVILGHPKVLDVGVYGVHDSALDTEVPRAGVVFRPEYRPVTLDQAEALAREIIQYVNGRVPDPQRLRGGVQCLASIPKSDAGKIMRTLMRDQDGGDSRTAVSGEQE